MPPGYEWVKVGDSNCGLGLWKLIKYLIYFEFLERIHQHDCLHFILLSFILLRWLSGACLELDHFPVPVMVSGIHWRMTLNLIKGVNWITQGPGTQSHLSSQHMIDKHQIITDPFKHIQAIFIASQRRPRTSLWQWQAVIVSHLVNKIDKIKSWSLSPFLASWVQRYDTMS